MAEALLSTALFLLISLSSSPAGLAAASSPPPSDLIRAACRATPYPSLCASSLSASASASAAAPRRSPRELSRAALLASEGRARSASAFIARLPARARPGPVRDCAARLSGAADRLGAAAREMGRLGRDGARRVGWHVSSARARCGAALAAERACLEGLARGGAATREVVRRRVADAARVASVALALLNRVGAGKCCVS